MLNDNENLISLCSHLNNECDIQLGLIWLQLIYC